MSTNQPKFTLRISSELLEKLKFIADLEGRSANKEIEQLIKIHVDNYEKINGEISI